MKESEESWFMGARERMFEWGNGASGASVVGKGETCSLLRAHL